MIQGEADEADIVTAVREHPHMQLLRDRLKAKKELLSQINRMCYSFLGDSRQSKTHCIIPGLHTEGGGGGERCTGISPLQLESPPPHRIRLTQLCV